MSFNKEQEFRRTMVRKFINRQEAMFDESGDSRVWFRKGQEAFDSGVGYPSRTWHPMQKGAWWMGWQAANLVNQGYQRAERGTAYYQTMPMIDKDGVAIV